MHIKDSAVKYLEQRDTSGISDNKVTQSKLAFLLSDFWMEMDIHGEIRDKMD